MATTSATAAKAKAKAKANVTEGKLSVACLVVAEGVKGREPVNLATTFIAKERGRSHAFVELANNERVITELTVFFEPPEGRASHGSVTL